jgi:hypothetical protein
MNQPSYSMSKPCREPEVSTFSGYYNGDTWKRLKQPVKIALLILTSIAICLVALKYLFVPLLAYAYPGSHRYMLDKGIYGAYPLRKYVSTSLTSPQANVVKSDESCVDGLILLSVGGQSVEDDGPMILDMAGNLVWSAPGQYGEASANTRIQRYRGQNLLTFWAGEKLQESGLGSYYLLNSSYDIVQTVSAVGTDLEGDLHEFKITEDGSALIIVYERTSVSLDDIVVDIPADHIIVNGILQEIDIATGELLFEWRLTDHLEHPALQNSSGGFVADGSFDYFHMNSIDKDSKGNYLISLRHLHVLVYVRGITGDILWTLGNDFGDFKDLSQGDATGFRWQHDARWISEDDGIISLFDNGMAHKHPDATYSQGLIIQLDFLNWTAKLLQNYTSRDLIGSASQGNVQLLSRPHDKDHVFIGWGASAAFTEHNIRGDLLCETHFGASLLFYFERVKSYRTFKTFDWKAIPAAWDPEAQIADNEIYVSWNGATEVAYWSLQSRNATANATQAPWITHYTSEKDAIGDSFEHVFSLPQKVVGTTYRIAALDSNQKFLRHSNETVYEHAAPKIWVLSVYLFCVTLLGLCFLFYARRNKSRGVWKFHIGKKKSFEYHALDQLESTQALPLETLAFPVTRTARHLLRQGNASTNP